MPKKPDHDITAATNLCVHAILAVEGAAMARMTQEQREAASKDLVEGTGQLALLVLLDRGRMKATLSMIDPGEVKVFDENFLIELASALEAAVRPDDAVVVEPRKLN